MAARIISAHNIADINVDNTDIDKLTYDIFSILESNFLFGCDQSKSKSKTKNTFLPSSSPPSPTIKQFSNGKVRILSIDAGGSTNGVLAAKSLVHLEAFLQRKSGNPNSRIADYFDVVSGAGIGGILASLLFTRGKDGGPMFTAAEALKFIIENNSKLSEKNSAGIFRRVFKPVKAGKTFKKLFGEMTLKDTLKSVLIPCYDLTTRTPFLFSRADAIEMDGCDFKIADVCDVSLLTNNAVELKSADGKKKISAVGNRIAMSNPTAAAVTHVLNNKQEFPFCNGVEDLTVVSLGNGEMDCAIGNMTSSPLTFVGIAGDGAADMVDQAVSMAFEHSGTNKYVRIQGNGIVTKSKDYMKKTAAKSEKAKTSMMNGVVDDMLSQKNVESVLFQGKKLGVSTNLEKLESFAGELIKEQESRKNGMLPPVVILKQVASPRSSSATSTLSTLSSC